MGTIKLRNKSTNKHMWIVVIKSNFKDIQFFDPINASLFDLENRVKDPEVLKAFMTENLSREQVKKLIKKKYAKKKDKTEKKKDKSVKLRKKADKEVFN